MKHCLILLILAFLTLTSSANNREIIYALGNSELTVVFSAEKNGIPEIVSARKDSLLKWHFSLGQSIFTPGQTDDAAGTALAATEYSSPVLVSNTKEFYELQVNATAKGSAKAPAAYSADLGIYVCRTAPIILVNLRQLRSTGSKAARIDFCDWNFLLNKDNYEISFSSESGALIQDNEYVIRIFPLLGKSSFTGVGMANIQSRFQPPWRFYLEPRESWDGFGPFLCIVITKASEKPATFGETVQQVKDFLKTFERPDTTPPLQ